VILSEILGEEAQEIERNGDTDGQTAGVPTGFTEFDQLTNGLHPGQMIVIAARPGVGKSTLALDFIRSAAIHHKQAAVF
ncbi:DnaB-like helicase C-terminal domain-containing protein, partial [Burkholderia multivorans]|uniref:DnaB-like helicase C-terminal domain-containing protein n=1 Tax=Burkholderia multivorans TaxID=87883 RepID=UPI00325FC683